MQLKTRLAARIRDNLAWEALQAAAPARPVSPWPQVRRLWAAPNDEFVRGLYHMLLGRDPDPDGLDYSLRVLRAGTPRAHLVGQIARSDEAAARQLDTGWLPELARYTPEGIWAAVLELWSRPAAEFVAGLYDLLLHRPVDRESLGVFLARLADGGSRADVVRVVVASVEFCAAGTDSSWLPRLRLLSPDGLRDRLADLMAGPDEAFVRGLYDAVLHRSPEDAEVAGYVEALARGVTRPALVRVFLTSPEARGRYEGPAWDAALAGVLAPPAPQPGAGGAWMAAPDPAEFVRGAYRAILGRDPSEGEVAARVRRLRLVPFYTRGRFLKSLARSWEAQAAARREAAEYARQADHLARRVGAAADAARGDGLLAEVYREVNTSRHHLHALAQLAGRVPEGLGEQLGRIEAAAANPPGLAPVADGIEELLAAADDLAVGQRRLRKALPRIRVVGRELLDRQRQAETAQRAIQDGVQRAITLAGELGDGQRQLAADQGRIADGMNQVVGEVRAAAADQGRIADGMNQVVGEVRRVAADQGRIADGVQELAGEVRAAAADQGRIAEGVRDLATHQQRLADYHGQVRQELADDRFATGVWFDQLRRVGAVVAEQVGAKPAAAAPDGPPAARADRCRVCGGELAFKWSARVLNDRYEAEYHECRACQALQVPDPVWLPEAYRHEADPLLWNPDPGRFRRNFTVFCYLRALAAAGLPAGRVLDYGGGYGLLVQMLADAGIDAWTHDQYVAHPYFATDRLIPRLDAIPDRAFDLVTAFEVFEHLTDPAAVGTDLRRLIRPGGSVIISTGLYDPAVHGPDWHYLSRAAGQHVLFWSRGAVRGFAARFGFASVGFFPACGFECAILADRPAAHLAEVLARTEERLWGDQFLGAAAAPWVLARPADRPAAPDVVPIEPPPGGPPCAS